MDVSTAFLYADILEKVFVEQPSGFEAKDKDGGDIVMQLEKSLYGLAQSPANWFHTMTPSLLRSGSSRSSPTRAVYLYDHDGCLLYTSPSPRDRQKSRMPSSA